MLGVSESMDLWANRINGKGENKMDNNKFMEFTYERYGKSIKAKIWTEHLKAKEVIAEIKRISGEEEN